MEPLALRCAFSDHKMMIASISETDMLPSQLATLYAHALRFKRKFTVLDKSGIALPFDRAATSTLNVSRPFPEEAERAVKSGKVSFDEHSRHRGIDRGLDV